MLFPRIRTFIILAAVLAVVFISYLPALKSDFVLWDDDVHILDNITIRGIDREHLQEMFTSTVNKIYIPLTSFSFAVEHHYFGYDPFIYHLDNVLLHLLVTAFVFVFARQMGLSHLGAAVAALLFGIHPMHVESVVWATERKDVLYAFFYMAAILSYGRYLRQGGYFSLAATTVLGVLSMLAKPMALSLPLILFLLDWFHGKTVSRRAVVEKIPLFILIGAIAWVTYSAHARLPGESVVKSVLIWPWTFVFYLRQFLFPFLLAPLYVLPKPIEIFSFEYFLSVLVLGLIGYTVIRFRESRWFVLAIAYYFLSIFFLLRYDDLKDTNIVADRFMYLPSLGLCLWIGMLSERLWLNSTLETNQRGALAKRAVLIRFFVVMFGGILFISAAVKTYRQCWIWNDSISLWQHQLRVFPHEEVALNNLATALSDQEEYQRAEQTFKRIGEFGSRGKDVDLSAQVREDIRRVEYLISLYKKAIKANPYSVDAPYNLGKLYSDIGMIPEAVEFYKKALLNDYKSKDVHFGLGDLYRQAGDSSQAVFAYTQVLHFHPNDEEVYISVIEAYTEALKAEPGNTFYQEKRRETLRQYLRLIEGKSPRAVSYFNLGSLYGHMGEFRRAVEAYHNALDINPHYAEAWYNLGNIYKDYSDWSEAVRLYERAIGINPRLSDAYLNIGIIHDRQGKRELAQKYYRKAMEVDPKNSRAYFNLGFIEEKVGNLRKAAELYEKSVDFDPQNAEGHYNLGNTYAKLKMEDEAISSYLHAVQENPMHMNAWVNLSILSFHKGDFAHAVKYCDEAMLLGYEAPAGYLRALAPYRKALKFTPESLDVIKK